MRIRALLTTALLLVATACGGSSAGKGATAIDITMKDSAFVPASINVVEGKAVVLRFHNVGAVAHEAYIGTMRMQRDHEQSMMGSSSTMMHSGDMHAGAVIVSPGKTMTLRHTFTRSEDGTLIGCHQPGHFAGGMKMTVHVTS